VRRSSPQVDLLAYLRAFVLLARNPQIALAPLAAALAELLLEKLVPTEGSGMIGALNGGLMGLIIQLVDFYALAVALIVAEAVWRRGRAPFDAAWEEARSKAGAILFAAIGFGFVLYVAGLVGGIAGGLGSIALTLVATFFFIYALPAAAIGGIPGSGALQISLERARSRPLATGLVTALCIVAFVFAPSLILAAIGPALMQFDSPYTGTVLSLVTAVAKALIAGYVALVLAKTYDDASYGRRY